MDEDDYFDDAFFDDRALEVLENNRPPPQPQAQQQQPQQQNQIIIDNDDDEFDDGFGDDIDFEALVQVEQQAATTTSNNRRNNEGNISFVPEGDDPIPPPRLPANTTSFHPLDSENLRTWIYPINYPVRGYQLNIVQKALFYNTLVALPTGLGKTFIAAVVMFNYWRWFPNSKIIFMAPTRPLVSQQIEACFSICGLPQQDTVDISGTTAPAKRREYWKSKRVFFATPQTISNDLQQHSCPAEKVVCVVVDEAHRATGNYAFTEVIRKLSKKNNQFRVLALTATPGARIEVVQNVVDNLLIDNIKIRTEESMDILPFTHAKNIEKIIVKLNYTEGGTGLVPRVVNDFKNQVFQPMLDQLARHPSGLNQSDADRVATYGLTANRMQFMATANNINNFLKFQIMQMYLVAEQMSRAYDMLMYHGIAPFIESIESVRQEWEESGKKIPKAQAEYLNNTTVKRLVTELKREMHAPNFSGHPKMDQLVAILLKHFTNLSAGANSKVMVFSSFRSSVTEICRILDQHSPLIRPSFFVGQSDGKMGAKGLKQKEQQEVIQKFKRDEFNVLVATSIGEEGLDIGEVDLIICYDSQTSPIRMLQRMGRTGRKRQGKCIMLLTEAEERKYNQAKETYNRIQKLISQGGHLTYYRDNPTIIPPKYKPAICRKVLDIGVYKQQLKKRKRGTAGGAGASAFASLDFETGTGLLKQDAQEKFVRGFNTNLDTFNNLRAVMDRYWPIGDSLDSLKKFVPLQTEPKPIYRVGHSRRTIQFTALVKKMEHRILYPDEEIKFDMPKKRQTTLMLPNKITGKGTTLMMPSIKKKGAAIASSSKKKKSDTEMTLDDALNDFLGPNYVSQLAGGHEYDFGEEVNQAFSRYDNDFHAGGGGAYDFDVDDDFAEDTRKNKIHDFFAPKAAASSSKKISPTAPSKSPTKPKAISSKSVAKSPTTPKASNTKSVAKSPVRDKGKGKMKASVYEQEDDSFDMMDQDWDPMLPDDLFENVQPLVDRQPITATELKIKKQRKQASLVAAPPISPILEEEAMDLDHHHPMIKMEPVDIKMDPPRPRRMIQKDEEEEDDDGFGMLDDDFPVGDLFIAEAQAMMMKGFDDAIDPIFPFEKQQQQGEESVTGVALIWTQTKPNFSKRALALLEQRQHDLHQVTGKSVAMSIYAKYNNDSKPMMTTPSKPSCASPAPAATIIPPKPIATTKDASIPSNPVTTTKATSIPPKPVITPIVSRSPSISASRPPSLPPSIPASPQQKQQQNTAALDNDDEFDEFGNVEDDLFAQAAALEDNNQVQQQQQQQQQGQQDDDDDMISIHNSDTSSGEEGGFGDIDFNEMTFADFLNNKMDFSGGQAGSAQGQSNHPTNNEQAPHLSQYDGASQLMKKKVSLYSKPSLSKKKQVYKSPSPFPQSPNDNDHSPLPNDFDSDLFPIDGYTQLLAISNNEEKDNKILISSQPIVDDDDDDQNSVILISETTPQRDDNAATTRSPLYEKDKNDIPQQEGEKYGSSSPNRLLPQLTKVIYPPAASPLANSPLRLGKLPPRTLSPRVGLSPPHHRSPLSAKNASPLGTSTPALQVFSPLRKKTIATSESEESPVMPVIRRKRRVIEVSPNSQTNLDEDEENDVIIPGAKPKKRLKRKASTPSTTGNNSHLFAEDDDDDEELIFEPPSKSALLQKLKQISSNHGKSLQKKKMNKADLIENPFVDMEAEESGDEGHSDDENDDDSREDHDEEEEDSFVVNDESALEPMSRISNEEEEEEDGGQSRKKHHGDIYRQSLNNDDIGRTNNKHWMNRFDADKWLAAGQENDSLIEEEEEEEQSVESISDFTSEIDQRNRIPSDPISVDDDDFM